MVDGEVGWKVEPWAGPPDAISCRRCAYVLLVLRFFVGMTYEIGPARKVPFFFAQATLDYTC